MSRIIVKNLPSNVTADKVREKFGEFGRVTDIQLKYTRDGKFRNFGFIGFETADEATNAINNLNNSFFGTLRLNVQVCAELGDKNKPKSWSKYAADSTAFQKLHGDKIDSIFSQISNSKKKKKDKKKPVNPELLESLKKYMDHPHFLDFLALRGKKDYVLKLLEENKSDDEKEEEEEKEKEDDEATVKENGEKENKSLAFAEISDSEYLKLKMKGSSNKEPIEIPKSAVEPKVKLYNVKINNLPYKAKKKDIKELLLPIIPASVRFIKNTKGVAYVGFKSEKEMRQALIKNKTFLNGKQLLITEVKEKVKIEKPDKWKKEEEALKHEESIAESGRIFVRNLPYSVTEEELEKLFTPFGPVTEVILPVDKIARQIRGYAIVTFLMPEHALAAYNKLDGSIFHGRMLHLISGKAKDDEGENDENGSGTFKKKKEKKLKSQAGSTNSWNSLFLNLNAVADVVAKKYKCSREDVLTGADAAVRLALGETQIVSETKQFLEDNGVHLDAFNQEATSPRSKTVMLVKNLPANTTIPEIRSLFVKFGELGRVLLPPSGITAIVEFLEPSEAKSAFKALAYTKFKHLPLYLEWAPDNTFKTSVKKENNGNENSDEQPENEDNNKDETFEDENENTIAPEPNATIFVKNLNFATTDEELRKHFEPIGKIASVQIAQKKDTKNPGKTLSMGYGFVQFYLNASASEAMKNLQGSKLDGHALELKRSNKTLVTEAVNTRKTTNLANQTGSKILVRNIPFQATEKEIHKLFSTFGEIKFVRLPKKMVGTGPHRGFGFVEFLSKNDAKRAMKSLCQSTHLLGRRLVMEWAKQDDGIDELRKRTAQHFHPDDPIQKKKKYFSLDGEEQNEEENEDEVED